MELFEAIRGRRSVRSYGKGDLPQNDLKQILEAAICAPSAGNLQSWEFVVVRDNEGKRALAEAAYGQDFITKAPVVIVACANRTRSASRYRERGRSLYSIQDTAAAIQNILLAAYALGYGSCWVGAFDEERAARIVHAPPEAGPVAIIPVGRPAESPEARSRLSLDKVAHFEKFS
jgi:nitroreductase